VTATGRGSTASSPTRSTAVPPPERLRARRHEPARSAVSGVLVDGVRPLDAVEVSSRASSRRRRLRGRLARRDRRPPEAEQRGRFGGTLAPRPSDSRSTATARPAGAERSTTWRIPVHDERRLRGRRLDAIADLPGRARQVPDATLRLGSTATRSRNARRVAYSHRDEAATAGRRELPGGDALSGRLREGGSGGGYAGDRAARSTAKAITRSATPKRETTAALTALFKYRAARELASDAAGERSDRSVSRGFGGAESDRLRRVDRNVRMPSGRRLIPDRPISSGMQRSTSQKRPWLAALLGALVTGFGHLYLRRWRRAVGWLAVR